MPQQSQIVLTPRKSPVQARSAATVDAIREATIQVLLSVGKERLTTTRVALRASGSVETLYQHFPNKRALLQAALKHHLDEVTNAVERVCCEQKGNTLELMATAVITAFLNAKMRDAKTSVALYAVSSRRLLEADAPEKQFNTLRHELIFLVRSYLEALRLGLKE